MYIISNIGLYMYRTVCVWWFFNNIEIEESLFFESYRILEKKREIEGIYETKN